MNSEQASTPLMATITKHLPLIEKVLLIALAFGIILTAMQMGSVLTGITLFCMGIAYFLYIYRPAAIPRQEGETIGGSGIIALMIVPKVLWMSSAISAFGIAFYLFDFGNDAYKNLLIVGGLSIGFCIILLLVFRVQGVKHLRTVTPIVLRAVPLGIMGLYILFK